MILLRHGRPVGGDGICYGSLDLPAGPGRAALAARLSAMLPEVDRVVTSPLGRCATLARAIGTTRRIPVTEDRRLAEIDFGRWEGLRWDDVPRPELDAWAADLLGARPHGGESVARLVLRVGPALEEHARGRALVVTHAGVIRAALHLAGRPEPWSERIGHGAWLELT